MNLRKSKLFFLLIAGISSLISCTVDGTNWDMDVTAPVVETRLDLKNLIGDDYLTYNPDSTVYLTVDETIYDFNLDTISSLPPVGNRYELQWELPPITLPGGTTIPGLSNEYDLDYDQVKLSNFTVKSGRIEVKFKSTLTERMIVRFYIPKATNSGMMFEFSDTLPGVTTPGDTTELLRSFDIDNYEIDLTGSQHDDFNKLTAFYDLSTISGDPDVALNTNQTVFICETDLVDITPGYAKGYLGSFNFGQVTSTTSMPELNIIQSGMIDLENVNLYLNVHNTLGADLRFTPVEIKGTHTGSMQTVILTHSSIGNSLGLNRAYETGSPSNPLVETITSINLTSGNSNIEQLIELIPDQLEFTGSLELNPFGNTGGYSDFFFYDYPPKIQLQINMPFSVGLSDLMLVDTIDNPFNGLEILDPVAEGEFIVRVENKFPLESNIQLYTLDPSYTITDSLFTNTVASAGIVDVNNRVTNPVTSDLIIQASPTQLQSLKNAEKLLLRASFSTIPQAAGPLQLYSDYYMLIRIIADVKFNIEL